MRIRLIHNQSGQVVYDLGELHGKVNLLELTSRDRFDGNTFKLTIQTQMQTEDILLSGHGLRVLRDSLMAMVIP